MLPDLQNDRDFGHFCAGRGTYWDDTTEFKTYAPLEKVEIGRYCSIAAHVAICTGGEHVIDKVSSWPFDNFLKLEPNPTRNYRQRRNTVIGHDVWIGHGAHVAGGAHVGHGAVIGARAVVMSNVPPYAVVVGNPGKVLRFRFDEGTISKLLDIAWWNWEPEVISDRIEGFQGAISEFVAQYWQSSSIE